MINLKRIFVSLLCVISFCSAFAQSKDVKLPANWYNLDLVQSGYFGISTERAYKELLSGTQPKQKVIVAVIDGGVDISHEDLKGVIWTNIKEIPGNGIDDDGNGYIDDVNGWNFIGSKRGALAYDNLELTRIRRTLLPKYISTTNLTKLDSAAKEEFELYKRVTKEFGEMYDNAHASFGFVNTIKNILDSIAVPSGKLVPTLADIENYKPNTEEEEPYLKFIRRGIRENGTVEKFYKEMKDAHRQYDIMLRYNLNIDYDQRKEMVGDNYSDSNERFYGNNDVKGPNADHGSHVSGIIAASRANGIGIDGIANNVRIMPIRVVPEGDERDKDVANGIRYAVDNGARIINMSFGKGFKWNKQVVDDAVKYAENKGVLLVHAAGNDNEDVDMTENYPNKYFDTPEAIAYRKAHKPKQPKFPFLINSNASQSQNMYPGTARQNTLKAEPIDTVKFKLPHASNWIEVGASAYRDDASLKATFSNYGKYMVDVFAPGFMINSTIPDSQYEEFDGTSMAAPVVSGVAALILSYYPDLKPNQIRDIIMKSVTKVTHKVKHINGKGESIRVNFADLCISGGIVNVYNALKLAEIYSP